MWYGVQKMSKYDINIKVQPLKKVAEQQFEEDERYQMQYWILLFYIRFILFANFVALATVTKLWQQTIFIKTYEATNI